MNIHRSESSPGRGYIIIVTGVRKQKGQMRLVPLCDGVVEYTHTRTSVLQPYVIFHYFSNCVEYRHLRFILFPR